MNRRQAVAAVATAAMSLSIVPLAASPAAAASAPEVVATGLDAPYKPTFGPDGALYVAEAGAGGDEICSEEPNPDTGELLETCYGPSGGVTRVEVGGEEPAQERVVTGLPSIASAAETVGPVDVAFGPDKTMHVIVGLGGDSDKQATFDERLGTVLRIDEAGNDEILTDLVAFEAAQDPDLAEYGEGISEGEDTNPFGLTFVGDDILAVDAGGNDVIRIDEEGNPTLETVLPIGMTEAPPFLGLDPGAEVPYQPVPTAIDVDNEGVPLVGELTGFPFPVGGAGVLAVEGEETSVRAEGFTNILDIDVAPDGTLYVLEFADNGLLADEPAPALVQVRPDGTRKYLLYGDEIPAPGGVEVGPDGMVYVTACTLCGPGEGMVWQVDPDVAGDPATADACAPADVPGTELLDVKDSVHREAIGCMVWWEVVDGFGDGTFGPEIAVTRAQAASMIARGLATAGLSLPADPPDAFSDDDDSVHESNLDALAELGVVDGYPDGTVNPSAPISRAQIASVAARAWTAVTGAALADGPDAFDDDDDSVHEPNIDAVAAAGWVQGTEDGVFSPSSETTRGQFTSILARMFSSLVSAGEATPPSA